ncbi:molybdate ABC transporter permease subunit, partial [Enterovibrio nigricans]
MVLTPLEWQALLLSLKISSVAVAVSLPLGIALAWLLARRDFAGKSLLDGLIHLPLVLPPVVIGYMLLVVMGRRGPVGSWLFDTFGLTFSFNWKGAALASAVVAFPLLVRAIRLSIELVDKRLEAAARTLGASPIRVFFTITLPLITPGIVSGLVLAFARSLGEFGATITFVSNIPGETQTIPLAMFAFIETPGAEQSVARLCIIAIVISLLSLFGSEWLSRR